MTNEKAVGIRMTYTGYPAKHPTTHKYVFVVGEAKGKAPFFVHPELTWGIRHAKIVNETALGQIVIKVNPKKGLLEKIDIAPDRNYHLTENPRSLNLWAEGIVERQMWLKYPGFKVIEHPLAREGTRKGETGEERRSEKTIDEMYFETARQLRNLIRVKKGKPIMSQKQFKRKKKKWKGIK